MVALPRRPDNVQAVGLNTQGLQLRTENDVYPVVDKQGLHLQASDFNGLQMPCYEIYDAQGFKHNISINDLGVLMIDDQEYTPRPLITSSNGSQYELQVDDLGVLKAVLVNV